MSSLSAPLVAAAAAVAELLHRERQLLLLQQHGSLCGGVGRVVRKKKWGERERNTVKKSEATPNKLTAFS